MLCTLPGLLPGQGVGSEDSPAVQVLVRSLVCEELIGQEKAGVSSHKGSWLEREMTEQKNIPASPGAVSLVTRSILETCIWPL